MNGLLSPAVIVQYLLRAVVVLITIPFHESAHALASHLLGDDTAVRAGRLSMNPLRHFDPLGALCMLVGGVGWAKPVSINPYNYKNPKVGMALSACQQSAAGVGVDDPVQTVLVQRAGGRRARADDVPILYGSHESEPGGFQSAAGAAV